MSEPVVLDASALLALLAHERGWERVQAVLPSALISTVNLAEVAGKLVDRGANPHDVDRWLDLGVERVEFDESMALVAAQMKAYPTTQRLSLGDRCCLATAWCLGHRALTADSTWARVDIDALEIELLR